MNFPTQTLIPLKFLFHYLSRFNFLNSKVDFKLVFHVLEKKMSNSKRIARTVIFFSDNRFN